MFRYIAFVWNPADAAQTETVKLLAARLRQCATDYQPVLEASGLLVSCAGLQHGASRPYRLHGSRGVVLGTVFEAHSSIEEIHVPRQASFGEQESLAVLASGGRELTTHYWGRYIAFLRDDTLGRTWILKDPTEHLPCFYTAFKNITIAFSCLSDCLRLEFVRFTINWNYLYHRVAFGWGPAGETALQEIAELYGGQCLQTDGVRFEKSFYWNPAAVAKHASLEDPILAARALRAVAKSCTHAWASCYPSILHRLSGGLDSSIVLGCLADAPARPHVTSMTYYFPHGNSDERPYARLAVHKSGGKHIEYARRAESVRFDDLLHMPARAHPLNGGYSYLEFSALERRLANENNARAVSTGDPGDCIFGSMSRPRAATDFVQNHGLRTDLLRIASELAPSVNTSIWTVIARALRDGLLPREHDSLKKSQLSFRKLLASELLQSASLRKSSTHPWHQLLRNVPGGTARMIMGLSIPREFYDPLRPPEAPDPEQLFPLFSQPLVELCLRIPSYVHAEGGRDRGLARRAFAPDVPQEILNRHWKDRGAGQSETTLLANRQMTRDILLDGVLVNNGLLDRRKLEAALKLEPTRDAAAANEIIDYVLVETWLKEWVRREQQIAA